MTDRQKTVANRVLRCVQRSTGKQERGSREVQNRPKGSGVQGQGLHLFGNWRSRQRARQMTEQSVAGPEVQVWGGSNPKPAGAEVLSVEPWTSVAQIQVEAAPRRVSVITGPPVEKPAAVEM